MTDTPVQPLRCVTGRAIAKKNGLFGSNLETDRWETEHEMLTLYLNLGWFPQPRHMNIKTVSSEVIVIFKGAETHSVNPGETPIGMNIGYIASERKFAIFAKSGTTFTYEYWTNA